MRWFGHSEPISNIKLCRARELMTFNPDAFTAEFCQEERLRMLNNEATSRRCKPESIIRRETVFRENEDKDARCQNDALCENESISDVISKKCTRQQIDTEWKTSVQSFSRLPKYLDRGCAIIKENNERKNESLNSATQKGSGKESASDVLQQMKKLCNLSVQLPSRTENCKLSSARAYQNVEEPSTPNWCGEGIGDKRGL